MELASVSPGKNDFLFLLIHHSSTETLIINHQIIQVNKLSFDEPSYPFRTGGDVTILQTSSSKPIIAVGYTNGIVRIYNYLNETLVATLKGHRSMISSLCFDEESVTLVSGGADSDIVLWDLVSYTALCRLRGHKDAITGVSFLKTPQQQYLVSVSKDTLLKVCKDLLSASDYFLD